MSGRFAVAVVGQDRPGIVAAVAGALLEVEGNVEDVATSILRGHFAMVLVVAGPDSLEPADVERAVGRLRSDDLDVSVWKVKGELDSTQATHALTVYGPDRPGIVHAVAAALAELGANVCDMVCRLHEGEPPVYVVTVEVAIPAGVDASRVESAVAGAVAPLGLESTLRSVEESLL